MKKFSQFAAVILACTPGFAVASEARFNLKEIAPGIFVHQGQMVAERTPANMGDQANIGFIVGAKCVATLDAGGSMKVGLLLREAIKNTTPKPICYEPHHRRRQRVARRLLRGHERERRRALAGCAWLDVREEGLEDASDHPGG